MAMNFSQRNGLSPVRKALQIGSMDNALKNGLINAYHNQFRGSLRSRPVFERSKVIDKAYRRIWEGFFKERSDKFQSKPAANKKGKDYSQFHDHVTYKVDNFRWNEVYDFVEFLSALSAEFSIKEFDTECARILEAENSGYRLVNGRIIPITSEAEISAIEEALTIDDWKPVTDHLQRALELLADRSKPDFRNSIKESISAVEAMSMIVTGNPKATLGQALKVIEEQHGLPGSMKSAFSALYGFSSNEAGIRHALIEEGTTVDRDDAKFMLVTCSAFVNYMRTRTARKA